MFVAYGIDELKASAGRHLGYSDWMEISQDRADAFAAITGGHQWAHAEADPSGSIPCARPIVPGYLALSLIIPLWKQVLRLEGVKMGLNYGLNRLRFPAPIPVRSRIRLGATLFEVRDVPGGADALVDAVIERADHDQPGMVAQVIFRYYIGSNGSPPTS